ncbi:MAG: DEAD/DEAH box helicase family protein [Acidobacteria bacterium]|nr:DEAD/DEAH box helicase family protein [Acidobacteriota bacterium]
MGLATAFFTRRLELLSFLVANGQLEIKVALRRRGMYHEKIGVFTDPDGDKIIFQGSANETAYALLPDFNFESINVFQSWRPQFTEHFEPYVSGFEKLWNNATKDTLVIGFPKASKDKLITIARRAPKLLTTTVEIGLDKEATLEFDEELPCDSPEVPKYLGGDEFSIREHQRLALESWKSSDLHGVMALATGAGKTITAIYGAVKIFEATKKLFVVIAVPYQSLADQWVEILTKFKIYPVKCYVSSALWVEQFTQKTALYNDGSLNFVCAVVVNATLQSANFQAIIRTVPSTNFLWIGDECHHHSSENLLKALPKNANMRLSCPRRLKMPWNDANSKLLGYYGPIVSSYSLAQALADGVLTPYKYYPILVDLTEAESAEYEELSVKIAQAAAAAQGGVPDPDSNEGLKLLLIKRARILGKAENKPILLKQLLADKAPQPLSLFTAVTGA